jgi:CBS domain containing-hemolysin-like protein
MVHSVAELRLLVNATQQAGGVEESEARIASRAFTFADLTAGALMTPRTEVDGLPVGLPLDELRARLDASPHTRLPVFEGSLDRVVGVLHATDFYKALDRALAVALHVGPDAAQTLADHLSAIDIHHLLRPTMVVPESKPADDLLDEMRASGRYFAVVLDEYGGTAGIVTVEDLLVALVGPMQPEQQVTEGVDEPSPAIAPAPDGSLLVDGLVRLDEWEEATGLRLDLADHEAVETVGGLAMARLARIPEVGDEVVVAGRTLRVEQMDGRRAALLRLLPAPVAADSTAG